MEPSQNASILLIEDDADDSFLLTRQLAQAQIDDHVTVIGNGLEAFDFLSNAHQLPIIIFLDLKLPGLSGIEFLRKIRREERFRNIPVVVMTGSSNPKDVEECEKLGVNDYLAKPIGLRSFIKTVTHVFPAARVPENN
jgi:two-component system response regulator